MLLTDKAKFDFLDWLVNNHEIDLKGFELGKDVIQNALIVEWLDSVGIVILLDTSIGYFYYVIKETLLNPNVSYHKKYFQEEDDSKTRNEAINFAIKKANEIYNSK